MTVAQYKQPLAVVLTGGGTGGHIYPAVAIGRGIIAAAPRAKIHYMGTAAGLEAHLVPPEGWPFHQVRAAGLERRLSLKTAKALLQTAGGYLQARRHLKKIKPQVVVGTGGYVCGPVVLAAAHLGIPTLIHEQNAYPGLTNRWLSRVAQAVCITFPEGARHFPTGTKVKVTGLPIREKILSTDRRAGLTQLGLPEGFRILIVGGSQGARRLNEAMIEIYDQFKDRQAIHWLHITGPKAYDEYLRELTEAGIDPARYGNIRIMPYVYQMEAALSTADLVIGRAGAGFLAEITAKGIPSCLIPYPFAAENHQEFNARALESNGAAVVITEAELSATKLAAEIERLLQEKDKLAEMAQQAAKLGKPDALQLIVTEVLQLVAGQA